MKSFLGNFYRDLAIFFWSHCPRGKFTKLKIFNREDLRKPKWESMAMEVNYLKNDVIGCLREVREWTKPKKAEKSVMTLLDDCVIRLKIS